MIRMLMLVVMCSVMACVQGPPGRDGLTGATGPAGPAGPRGPQGEPGVPGGGSGSIIWRDSAGVLAGSGDRLVVRDSNGYWWFINAETALADSDQHQFGPPAATLYFTSTDCTGSYFIAGPLPAPRVPFAYGGTVPWRVRSDTARFQQIAYRSSKATGSLTCSSTPPGGIAAFLMADADAPMQPGLSFPALGLSPPLHMERLP